MALSCGRPIREQLTFFQLFVIVMAAVDVYYPNLKQLLVEGAVRFISVIEYLGMGSRHQVLSGQLLALVDHVATQDYRRIHIVDNQC